MATTFLVLPGAITGIIGLLMAVVRKTPVRKSYILLSWTLGISVFYASMLFINTTVSQKAVADAKAYPDMVAHLLEEFRKANGHYPADLNQLPQKPPIPRYLKGPNCFRSDSTNYYFSFPAPNDIIDEWQYDSTRGTWRLR